jgi:hypothetical protein
MDELKDKTLYAIAIKQEEDCAAFVDVLFWNKQTEDYEEGIENALQFNSELEALKYMDEVGWGDDLRKGVMIVKVKLSCEVVYKQN